MIDPSYVQMMARYNRWQNGSLYTAAGTLTDAARRADRGAFFGSIHGTLSHLLWGDGMWMHRFCGSPRPEAPIGGSAAFVTDWDELCARREAMDTAIADWSATVDPLWLQGTFDWFSSATNRHMSRPLAQLVVHFFNHQTHHRGQVHALLTAAGAKPDDTDLMLLSA